MAIGIGTIAQTVGLREKPVEKQARIVNELIQLVDGAISEEDANSFRGQYSDGVIWFDDLEKASITLWNYLELLSFPQLGDTQLDQLQRYLVSNFSFNSHRGEGANGYLVANLNSYLYDKWKMHYYPEEA